MKKLLALIMLFGATLISSADVVSQISPDPSADGYFFDGKSFTRLQFRLIIIPVKDTDELLTFYNKFFPLQPIPQDRTIKGFALINSGKDTCTIYIVDPEKVYAPEFLGHELTHCIYGYFHKDW